MTKDYTSLKATAERLIQHFGRSATLRTMTATGSAWAPTLTPSDTTVNVCRISSVRQRSYHEEKHTQHLDEMFYLSTSAGVTPTLEDSLVVDDQTFTVKYKDELGPSSTVLYWILGVVR